MSSQKASSAPAPRMKIIIFGNLNGKEEKDYEESICICFISNRIHFMH